MSHHHIRAQERRWRRGDAMAFFGAIVLGCVLAWIVFNVRQVSQDLQSANAARDALASQVQRLGGTPVAGPPGSRGEPGKSPRGPRGYPGKDGVDGKAGTNATGKPGSPGKNGQSGATGKGGTDGQNSTVPGPSGGTGPPGQNATGAPGQPGKDGKDGVDGKDGSNGRDGPTCPSGYSLQPSPSDPDALVCRKDGAPAQQDQPTTAPSTAGLVPERKRR